MDYERSARPKRPTGGRYLREDSKKKPKRRRRKTRWPLFFIAAVVILLIAAIIYFAVSRTDAVMGTWRYDEVTAYEFDGNGKGKLILQGKEYAFTYEITEGELFIDFESDAAKDITYTYSLRGNQLTLEGKKGAAGGSFSLTRE